MASQGRFDTRQKGDHGSVTYSKRRSTARPNCHVHGEVPTEMLRTHTVPQW